MTIGISIKRKRMEIKLTQSDLAKIINVSSQVISNWEREYTHPTHEDLTNLADALDVTSDYLLGRSNNLEHTEENSYEAFRNDPSLERWYRELPLSKEEDLRRLRRIWKAFKEED